MIQLRLPAPEEQMREALEKMGKQDWNDVAVSILDCTVAGDDSLVPHQPGAAIAFQVDVGPKHLCVLAADDQTQLTKRHSLQAARRKRR